MENNEIINEFIEKFINIKNKGWIKSHRIHDTGIGKTFEDEMGIDENNSENSDFKDLIEIKTQRGQSSSRVTLFTKSPKPTGINTEIKEKYGQVNEKGFKEIHTTFDAVKFNSYKNIYGFKLNVDEIEEKIEIYVKDFNSNEVNNIAHYDFETLKTKLTNKHKNLAYIGTKNDKREDGEYFKYETLHLFSNISFEKFISLVKRGDIVYDIRIGTYNRGKNKGKTHDHGSGFRCTASILNEMFEDEKIIN